MSYFINCPGIWYGYLGDKRRFIVELRRILLDLLNCSLEGMRQKKFSQLLMAFSNIFQRHIRKVFIHKMTFNKALPEEHPSIVSDKLIDYEIGFAFLLTNRISKPCLPLTIALVHLLDSINKVFQKVPSTLYGKYETSCKKLHSTETVKIDRINSGAQSQSFPVSIPKSKISHNEDRTFSPPSIVVKGLSENISKVSNSSLECESESENTLNNYHQSMKEKLQRITVEVKNTKESVLLSTSAAIKRLFSPETWVSTYIM